MPLEEIDISDAQVLSLALNLVNMINNYNLAARLTNAAPETLPDVADELRAHLQQIHDMAAGAFHAIVVPAEPWIEALGMPNDMGWSYELGYLTNLCNTLIQQLNDEVALALADQAR